MGERLIKINQCLAAIVLIGGLALGGCAIGDRSGTAAPGKLPVGAKITLDDQSRGLGNVTCDFYKAGDDQGLEQFEIRCAGWERYTGLVWRGDQSSAAVNWEKTFLETGDLVKTVQEEAQCASPEPTRILNDQPAWLRRCASLNGGFPYLLLASGVGNRVFVLWGPAHLAPLYEGFILTSLRGTEQEQEPGSRSQLIALAEQSIVSDGRQIGLEDMGQFATLDELGGLYNSAKHHRRALDIVQRALEIHERIKGVNDPGGGYLVSRIGREFSRLQPGAAESMFQRAEAMVKASPDAADWPELLVYRAWHELTWGHPTQAEQYARQSWEAIQEASGRAPNRVAHSLISLGDVYVALDRLDEATAAYMQALKIFETVRGGDYHWVGETRQRLAEVDRRRRSFDTARAHIKAAIEVKQGLFGDGRALAEAMMIQANIERDAGQPQRALELWRETRDMLLNDRATLAELQSTDLEGYLELLFQQAGAVGDRALLDEAFTVAQLGQSPAVGRAVTQAAARLAENDPAVRDAARALQDALKARQDAQYELGIEQSKPANVRNAEREEALKSKLRTAAENYQRQEQQLQVQFPRYGQLVTPSPLNVAETAQLLQRDEALLRVLPGQRETWVFLVKADGTVRGAVAKRSARELAMQVEQLRVGVDASGGTIPDFDLTLAHDLYQQLLGSLDTDLAGVKHLVFVPSGVLLSLPPTLLVRQPAAPRSYQQAAWLVRDMALSVLPSVIALQQFRQIAGSSRARSPFIGFGDPVFADTPAASAAAAPQMCVAGAESPGQLAPLPETAAELRTLASTLGAQPGQDVVLGQRATVSAVQASSLQNYRIIAFATHALLPGELDCLTEPALALTPSGSATAANNGLLRASAIANLRLDAEWVLLSACNTAGSGGDSLRGEGLSGLATAFFYAGTRALLASHWYVFSKPTVFLTTRTFETFRNSPGVGRAEALRRAQLALLNDATTAHPVFWAAFTLIGENTPR